MHFTKNTKSVGQLGPTGPYATPAGAEGRTFELTVDSIYELWLVDTFTGWSYEKLWTSEPHPFDELDMKLTFKERTIAIEDLRWLLERVFRLHRGSSTLRCPLVRPSSRRSSGGPSKLVLDTLVQKVHLYLTGYDLSALLDDVPAAGDWALRVKNKSIPTFEDGLAACEAYLQVCFDCVRLTYFYETNYLR